MRVRIESDGTPAGTNIYDSVTGKALTHIKAFTLQCDAKDPFVQMEILQIPVDSAVFEDLRAEIPELGELRIENQRLKQKLRALRAQIDIGGGELRAEG
jgi:hypothetical protein